MDSRPGLTITSPSSGTRTGRSNTRTLPPDALLECAGRTRWAFGIRESDVDYPVTIIEGEGFPKLISTSAVVMNQPFGLFFSTGIVLIPVIFECVRTPPVPAGKGRIRIAKFEIMRHCHLQWRCRLPVVQAGSRIITYSRTTLKPSLSKYSMNASTDNTGKPEKHFPHYAA